MIISDPRFGAELVTDKGKVFVFDDLNCYWNYRNNKALKAEEIAHSVVVIFNKPGTFKEADQLCFLQSGAIRSPMGSGMAAFDGDSVCKAEEIRLKAVLLSWEGVAERLR
jgi:copper chaperone NosL